MIAYFVSRTELTSMITQSRSKDKRNGLTRNTGVNIRLRGLKKTERLVKMQILFHRSWWNIFAKTRPRKLKIKKFSHTHIHALQEKNIITNKYYTSNIYL